MSEKLNHFSADILKNVPREYDVVYSWIWSSVITREGIDERLHELTLAGIKHVYVIPLPKDFRPEALRTFLDPEYLSEEFFGLISYAEEKANELGIGFWVYDEGGWPSGGANFNTIREYPEAAVTVVKTRERKLRLGEYYELPSDCVAVFHGKNRLPESFTAHTDMTLEEFYTQRFTSNPNIIDLTNPRAVDTFINNTYEKYKACLGERFGKRVPVFFTDEPALLQKCIPFGLFEKFEARYGYDLRDYLYVLKDYGKEAVSKEEIRARIDYGRLIGELIRDNAFTKLRDWCRENGIIYGGHLNNDNIAYGGMYCGCFGLVECLRRFDLPGIDVIWEQIRYPYENRSCLNDETRPFGFFPRLASSAARQEGRVRTLSETFAIYGDAITPDEMRFVINYQLIRGINGFNFMSMPQSDKRCAALMCRPAFSPRKPGFFNMRHLHEYVERLCYLSSLGKVEGDTALYHPAADYWSNPDEVISATESFGRAGAALENANIHFDIIDDYGIMDAVDTGDGLMLGDATYRHVVVPECKHMPDEVRKKIEPYLSEGTPILSTKSDKIRIMTRIVDKSRLYFFFNEGLNTVTEKFDIATKKHLYQIDPCNANIYEREYCEPTLLCGEIAVFLVTDEVLDTVSDEVAYSHTVDGFCAVSHDRFLVTYSGTESKHYDRAPVIAEDFSGTVLYEARLVLPEEPRSEDRYRIVLEDSSVSASVLIDGVKICDVGISPMQSEIPGKLLKRDCVIGIKLSNTAANELVAKKQFIFDTFPKAEIGLYTTHYPDRQAFFEERRPPLKLGKVRIEKLV